MVETKECPKCQGRMYHNQGVSKKTGKPYENWKCSGCQDIEWVGHKKAQNGNAMLMDELVAFRKEMHERLDGLGEFLSKWLSEKGK
jgi:hypothetical protein